MCHFVSPRLAHAQSVTVAWDANTEPNLAGYVVFYGTQSGIYPLQRRRRQRDDEADHGESHGKYALLFRGEGLRHRVETEPRVERSVGRDRRRHGATAATTATAADEQAPTLTTLSPTSGPKAGGTLVTLNGTNFVSGAKVYFGGVLSPSITFVSATQLRATTPAGSSGNQAVTMVNPSGLNVVKQNAFQFTGPKPKILTSSPTTGAISGGTELRITVRTSRRRSAW